MTGLRLDFREAARTWFRQPGLAALAILTLTVGLSGAITIFSAFRAAVFDLPLLPDAHRIANVWGTDPAAGLDREMPTLADYHVWKGEVTGLEEMAAYSSVESTMSGGDEPVRVSGQEVSEGYFAVLGVRPVPCWAGASARSRTSPRRLAQSS
jgi:hypothetical protein